MDFPRTPSFRLEHRRALVTGATSGIGLGCAVALAEAGAKVTVAARSAARTARLAQHMGNQGWTARALRLDITDIEQTRYTIEKNPPFDILVNSAGIARHSPSLETTPQDFDAVTAVNAKGAYFLMQAVAKGLINAGKPGSLINISSQMAHVGGIERAVYCGSKHALTGYIKAMAIEWGGFNIRVNNICPTFVHTSLTAPTFANPERVKWIKKKIKLGRLAKVEDIMGTVLYLASDASAMVTGTSLLIDGGWIAG